MELPIIKIGNSKGLRLSKEILKRYHMDDKVELILKKDHIIIKPLKAARSKWDQAFQKMHENGDDVLLVNDVFEEDISE